MPGPATPWPTTALRTPSKVTAVQRVSEPADGAGTDGCRPPRSDRRRRDRAVGPAVRRPDTAAPSSRRCGTGPRRLPARRGRVRGSSSHAPSSANTGPTSASAVAGLASACCTSWSPPAASNARSACRPYSLASVAQIQDHWRTRQQERPRQQDALHLDAARRHRRRLRVAPVVLDLARNHSAAAVAGDASAAMSISTSALSWSSFVTAMRYAAASPGVTRPVLCSATTR